ncbi:MAG: PrsW family intramembrane metalloprotease [Anaerolineae bacterium]|nr:PrsW family intramembrane metalloprotease [Anaerolineae bacterium]MDH7472425.1 PrsW family glutamic-type intramembrane protease [Anaerolineae bacterium]
MLLRIIKAFVAAVGLSLVATGPLAGAVIVVFALVLPQETSLLSSVLIGASFAALGLGLGGPLAWHGVRALLDYPSASFRPPRAWLLALGFAPVVILGQLFLSLKLVPWLTLPPFHVMAIAIPPACILAYAGRRLAPAGVRWRDVVLQGASGAFLSTTAAFILEMIAGLSLILAVAVIVSLTPSGQAEIEDLLANLQDPLWMANVENLYDLLLRPGVALPMVLMLVVIIPLIEEPLKPLGMLLLSYRRPTRAQAWLGGLACGAGFALAEGLLNTATSAETWGLIAPVRVGASLMHCLTCGLIAVGWQQLLAERRPWKLAGAFVLSLTMHALWNLAAVGIVGVSLTTITHAADELAALSGLGLIGLLSFLVVLTLGMAGGLVWLTRRLE